MQALGRHPSGGPSAGRRMALECLETRSSHCVAVAWSAWLADCRAVRRHARLARARFTFTLGRSRGLLHEGVGELPPDVEYGMIAGSHAVGIDACSRRWASRMTVRLAWRKPARRVWPIICDPGQPHGVAVVVGTAASA